MSSSLLDTSPVLVFGSLSLSGNILRLGSASNKALSISGTALHINEVRISNFFSPSGLICMEHDFLPLYASPRLFVL